MPLSWSFFNVDGSNLIMKPSFVSRAVKMSFPPSKSPNSVHPISPVEFLVAGECDSGIIGIFYDIVDQLRLFFGASEKECRDLLLRCCGGRGDTDV